MLCFLVRCLGNFDLIFILIPLLTDNVTHSSDNAEKKKHHLGTCAETKQDTSRGSVRNRKLHHSCYMLVDFRAFRSFSLQPHGVIEVVLRQEEFSFPTVLSVAVNVVSLGEFLASWFLGLPDLQWQAWISGDRGAGSGCMLGGILPAGTSVVLDRLQCRTWS